MPVSRNSGVIAGEIRIPDDFAGKKAGNVRENIVGGNSYSAKNTFERVRVLLEEVEPRLSIERFCSMVSSIDIDLSIWSEEDEDFPQNKMLAMFE